MQQLRCLLFALLMLAHSAMASSADWRSRPSDEIILTASDIKAEQIFGKNIAARILAVNPALDNSTLNRYINLVGQALVSNTNRPEIDFHFSVLDSDALTSYATPGGYIFIGKGALKAMQDEAELAGVLAHEIAHVLNRQIVTRLKIRGEDETTNLAQLVSGNAAALLSAVDARKGITINSPLFADTVDNGFKLIHIEGYNQQSELQADLDALHISILSGYDPAGLARYLIRIKSHIDACRITCSNFDLLPERVAQIEAFLKLHAAKLPAQKNSLRFQEMLKQLQ